MMEGIYSTIKYNKLKINDMDRKLKLTEQEWYFVKVAIKSLKHEFKAVNDFYISTITDLGREGSLQVIESVDKKLSETPTKVYYEINGNQHEVEFDFVATDEEVVEYFEDRFPDFKPVKWHK